MHNINRKRGRTEVLWVYIYTLKEIKKEESNAISLWNAMCQKAKVCQWFTFVEQVDIAEIQKKREIGK